MYMYFEHFHALNFPFDRIIQAGNAIFESARKNDKQRRPQLADVQQKFIQGLQLLNLWNGKRGSGAQSLIISTIVPQLPNKRARTTISNATNNIDNVDNTLGIPAIPHNVDPEPTADPQRVVEANSVFLDAFPLIDGAAPE